MQDEATPSERLRALDLSSDPDARNIAQQYKSSPLTPGTAVLRQVTRTTQAAAAVFQPTYAQATEADASEAEAKVAAIRARREQHRREREQQLHDLAKASDRREASMLRLTKASVIVALTSLAISAAALLVAITAH